jgi:NAD dependent epimerase/dehydratase family enzyme
MIILIAGGTGFVGRELIKALLAKQHKIFVLGREISKIKSQFHDQVTPISWQDLDATDPDVDAVINLCGANISQSRWTDHIKRIIIDSRVNTSLKLASWCARASNPPRLTQCSAVGIYGSYSGDHTAFTEKSPNIKIPRFSVKWDKLGNLRPFQSSLFGLP